MSRPRAEDIEELARHLYRKVVGRSRWMALRPSVRTFYRKLARAALEYPE